MTDSLKMQCELLTENQLILKKALSFESAYIIQLVSCIYAHEKSLADPVKIKEALALIKRKTCAFSQFRASVKTLLAAIISLDPEPEKLFDKILSKHDDLKVHFRSSTYLPYAAYLLAKHGDTSLEAIKEYFKALKPSRPIFGLENDVVIATIYSLFGKNVKYTVSDVDFYAKELSEHSFRKHSAKISARILALGEKRGYTERLCLLKELLQENGIKFGCGAEAATLAPLVLLDLTVEDIEEMIWEFIDHFEKASKKPKLFQGKQLSSFAAWLTYSELIKNAENASYIFAKEAGFAVILANSVNMTAAQYSVIL